MIILNKIEHESHSLRRKLSAIFFCDLTSETKCQIFNTAANILIQLEMYICDIFTKETEYINIIAKIIFPEKFINSIYSKTLFASQLLNELVLYASNEVIRMG